MQPHSRARFLLLVMILLQVCIFELVRRWNLPTTLNHLALAATVLQARAVSIKTPGESSALRDAREQMNERNEKSEEKKQRDVPTVPPMLIFALVCILTVTFTLGISACFHPNSASVNATDSGIQTCVTWVQQACPNCVPEGGAPIPVFVDAAGGK